MLFWADAEVAHFERVDTAAQRADALGDCYRALAGAELELWRAKRRVLKEYFVKVEPPEEEKEGIEMSTTADA